MLGKSSLSTPPSRRFSRPLWAATLATALLAPALWSPAAHAADEDPNARATARYEAGQAAAKKGKWQEAYAAFREAWSLRRHPQIALNLGRAALKIGEPREAAERLSFFLRESPELAPGDRKQVEVLLVEAKKKVGTLTIGVNRPNAELFIDGTPLGRAPLGYEVFADPGSHEIEARVPGGGSAKTQVEVQAGSKQHAGLWVMEVDGGSGVTPGGGAAAGGGGLAGSSGGETEAPSSGGGARPYLIGAGIVGTVAGAGAGAVLAVLSLGKASEGQDARDARNQGQYESAERDRVTFANASFYTFIGAGALGLAMVGIAVFGGGSKEGDAGVRVEARGNGLVVRGAW
ncbi:PEGA domain-containing protein [Chondromyces crocatus]|uniref:PEGA domain-containing protein n=1 Tax=Chondromyces crocatus TaxID=52 RepID=A0A0K1EGW8_CHOCO|nr:PEGA domain-containing protein [Chondromyces crocatus]AKT40084.1 uncharacterized protein CMC5_042370 [Chondromyces crocatus]